MAPTTAAAAASSSRVEHGGRERRANEHPVSVLFSRRVKERREADFEAWARGVTAAAQGFPGQVSASVLRVPGSREYHVLYTFADRSALNDWLDSGDRARWMSKVGEMTEAERGLQSMTGLETWFTLPGDNASTRKPPPRWKMWLVTVAAIYPFILALFGLLAPRIEDLPLALRALVFPLVLVTLMTYAVMPLVTRLLRRWLA